MEMILSMQTMKRTERSAELPFWKVGKIARVGDHVKPKIVMLEDGLAGAGAVVSFRPGTWYSAGACQARSLLAFKAQALRVGPGRS